MLITLKKPVTESVPAAVPSIHTLGDVRDLLSSLPADASAGTKLQISAINTVARASGCAPEDLPASPALLREHLNSISPAMAGLTHASWSSVRSRILKALERAEVAVIAGRRTTPLSPQWSALYNRLPRNALNPHFHRPQGARDWLRN